MIDLAARPSARSAIAPGDVALPRGDPSARSWVLLDVSLVVTKNRVEINMWTTGRGSRDGVCSGGHQATVTRRSRPSRLRLARRRPGCSFSDPAIITDMPSALRRLNFLTDLPADLQTPFRLMLRASQWSRCAHELAGQGWPSARPARDRSHPPIDPPGSPNWPHTHGSSPIGGLRVAR